ncbi:MAG: penicillin-binding protein [Solobacterium sp.]|nr:penicillin-binding protein [Solobacterium sp.]
MYRRTQRVIRFIFLITLAIMCILTANVFVVSVGKKHLRSGTDLGRYASTSNTVHIITKALRGNIYDRNHNVIAQDVRTYNIYCILDTSRPSPDGMPGYVVDKEDTAEKLAPFLHMDKEAILSYLNQDLYQTELGINGRNLSQTTMEAIKALNLPGVEFDNSIKRSYPLGTFASNLIGFAQSDEFGSTVGKMGTELYLNSYLSGTDGERTYQADRNGHILPGMKENTISAVNGFDVYTTIDQEIQEALEESFTISKEIFDARRAWGAVMEISTGRILAWGQYPSFDPNTLEIEDYNNYGAQLPYEPGSTMKTFTYAAAINEGVYDGSMEVYSGPYCFYSDENNNPVRVESGGWGCIYNAGRKNYGMIDLDHGLIMSLNTVTAEVENTLITPDIYLDYLKKFGFFQSVDTDGLPEETGSLNFRWPADKLSLCYGQGSTVTMLQMLQAYSAVFGDGTMVRPYYIDSIRDSYDPSHVLYQAQTQVVGHPITAESAKELQRILYLVMNDERGTARHYQIPECKLMGKTGTAEVAASGNYSSGYTITSVMCALPAENPQVMVYYCFEAIYNPNGQYYTDAAQNLLRKTAIRLGFAGNAETESGEEIVFDEILTYDMPSLVNHTVDYASWKLNDLNVNTYVLGNGSTIISQYPEDSATVNTGQRVFLVTDTNSFIMPDLTGWTRKDVTGLWSATQFGFRLEGEGRVVSQNIAPGTPVSKGVQIEVVFE